MFRLIVTDCKKSLSYTQLFFKKFKFVCKIAFIITLHFILYISWKKCVFEKQVVRLHVCTPETKYETTDEGRNGRRHCAYGVLLLVTISAKKHSP